jgi:hypothetical protein
MEPESWVGQQVSVYLDVRGSGETKAIGVLELLDDTGVIIVEDEEVVAYYPWRTLLAIKVGEPEEPSLGRGIRGRRTRQIEGSEESRSRSGLQGPTGPSRRPQGPSGKAQTGRPTEDQEGADVAYTSPLSSEDAHLARRGIPKPSS